MELPFETIKIIKIIYNEPGILVAFAAFHPFALLVLFIPLWFFKKIGIYTPKEELNLFGTSITLILAFGWIIGFASQILLFFIGINGLKMLLIYLSMYICIVAFVTFNVKKLKKQIFKNYTKTNKN
jgi:hypothetical protein